MSSTYETVKIEHENGIAWVILNRPDKRNAMSPQLHYDMCEVLDELEHDPQAKVLGVSTARSRGRSQCLRRRATGSTSATSRSPLRLAISISACRRLRGGARTLASAHGLTALAAARRCRSRSRESVIAAGVDHAPPSPGAEAWMARAWTPF